VEDDARLIEVISRKFEAFKKKNPERFNE